MDLTQIQREEIEHLLDIAEGEVERGDHFDVDRYGWELAAVAFRALLNGEELTEAQRNVAISELENHADKVAPARATQFRPADPGDRRTFASIGHLIRKLQAVKVEA